MAQLSPQLHRDLVTALIEVPNIGNPRMRDALLAGLPIDLRATIARSDIANIDLSNIVDVAGGWDDSQLGQLLDNVLMFVGGSQVAEKLIWLREQLPGSGDLRTRSRAALLPPRPPEPWADRPEYPALQAALLAGGPTTLCTEGRGGVGKTALAAKLAWDPYIRVAYPDGCFWIPLGPQADLGGRLADLAAAYGTDLRSEPDLHSRVTIVRALLAERRTLCIFDDVWDMRLAGDQLRDLAPTALLTTRDHAVARAFAPGQTNSRLATLTNHAAQALLLELAPRAAEQPSLMPAVARILVLAGGLPLLLGPLAAVLDEYALVGWPVARLLTRLDDPAWRSQIFVNEAAILGKSLDFLSSAEASAYVQLAVFGSRPATFDLSAAQTIWACAEGDAEARLLRFQARHLLDAEGNGRFSLHQSLYEIALERLSADDPAASRHTHYYLDLINRDPADWRTITAELEQIRRAWGAVATNNEQILAFIWAMYLFLTMQGLWSDALNWCERGLTAARALQRGPALGTLLNHIGELYRRRGEARRALAYYEQALPIFEAEGDRTNQAVTLNNLGLLYDALGEQGRALVYYEQALPIFEAVGDRMEQANTLSNIGALYNDQNDPRRALDYLDKALLLREALGDRSGQAITLNSIGLAYRRLGDLHRALEYYDRVLPLREAVGDRPGLAITLNNIGRVYWTLGDAPQALTYYQRALPILEAVGDRASQSITLFNIARIYRAAGDLDEAERLLAEVVALDTAIEAPDLASDRAEWETVRAARAAQRPASS